MWELIRELYTNSRLIAVLTVLLGCYILRDVIRVIMIFADGVFSGERADGEEEMESGHTELSGMSWSKDP